MSFGNRDIISSTVTIYFVSRHKHRNENVFLIKLEIKTSIIAGSLPLSRLFDDSQSDDCSSLKLDLLRSFFFNVKHSMLCWQAHLIQFEILQVVLLICQFDHHGYGSACLSSYSLSSCSIIYLKQTRQSGLMWPITAGRQHSQLSLGHWRTKCNLALPQVSAPISSFGLRGSDYYLGSESTFSQKYSGQLWSRVSSQAWTCVPGPANPAPTITQKCFPMPPLAVWSPLSVLSKTITDNR